MAEAFPVNQPGVSTSELEFRRALSAFFSSDGIVSGLAISTGTGTVTVQPGTAAVLDDQPYAAYYIAPINQSITLSVDAQASGTRTDLIYVGVNDTPGDISVNGRTIASGEAYVGRVQGGLSTPKTATAIGQIRVTGTTVADATPYRRLAEPNNIANRYALRDIPLTEFLGKVSAAQGLVVPGSIDVASAGASPRFSNGYLSGGAMAAQRRFSIVARCTVDTVPTRPEGARRINYNLIDTYAGSGVTNDYPDTPNGPAGLIIAPLNDNWPGSAGTGGGGRIRVPVTGLYAVSYQFVWDYDTNPPSRWVGVSTYNPDGTKRYMNGVSNGIPGPLGGTDARDHISGTTIIQGQAGGAIDVAVMATGSNFKLGQTRVLANVDGVEMSAPRNWLHVALIMAE